MQSVKESGRLRAEVSLHGDKKLLTVVSNSEFRPATRPQTACTVVSVDISARKLNFRDHIDVRGMRRSAGRRAGFSSMTPDGGRGRFDPSRQGYGALKEEIRRYLRTVPEVECAKDSMPTAARHYDRDF